MVLFLGAFTLAGSAMALPLVDDNVNMSIAYSGPTGYGYYGDYDVKSDDSPYVATGDAFCVSKEHLVSPQNYDIYGLDTYEANYANLFKAAWIADQWLTNYSTNDPNETYKLNAQGAIWAIMGVIDKSALGDSGLDYELYSAALNNTNYTTSNWLFAASDGTTDSQDYLAQRVPEPATLLLLGTGLMGLAFSSRRRIKR